MNAVNPRGASVVDKMNRFLRGQGIKWCIYGLLVINFFLYFFEEISKATLVLNADSSWLAWSAMLKTTIDEIGWIGLLLAFELETYHLSYRAMALRRVRWSLWALRFGCYALLFHTVLTNVNASREYLAIEEPLVIEDLCQLPDQGFFYRYNLDYQSISGDNCQSLSSSSPYFEIESQVVTNADGFKVAGWHAWFDLQDALAWIVVVLAIELAVRLQNQNVTRGRLMLLSQIARIGYLVLVVDGIFWFSMGHYLYAFDQALWIGGFWVIERNLNQWRVDIDQGKNYD